MPNRQLELPNTVAQCHTVILDLHATVDDLEFRLAQPQRELYGQRRERFIDDGTDIDGASTVDEATTGDGEMDSPQANPPGTDPLIDDLPDVQPSNNSDNEPSLDRDDVVPSLDSPSSADDSSDCRISDPTSTNDPPSDSTKPRPNSNGRRPRQLNPNTPREKVYHPLDQKDVPVEIWNHPSAKRFFRFVREEVELPQHRLRILEHYQEVIVLEDPSTVKTTMTTAKVPEPMLERCYAGPSLLAYLVSSQSIRRPLTLLPGRGYSASKWLNDSSFYAMALDAWSRATVNAVGQSHS